MIKAVIMAGGSGTRFWPLSRRRRPKQFLPITGDKTMLEETVLRLLPLIPMKDVLTVANAAQTRMIRKLLPKMPGKNLIIEPLGKNTAASLILATARVYLENPESVVAALPADHLIKRQDLFLEKLRAGAAAAAKSDSLITFGIPPSYPATGYGYIHFSKKSPKIFEKEKFFSVLEFKEKPDYELALKFLESKDYHWNSGMFLWRAEVFAEKLKRHSPAFSEYWERILEALKKKKASGLGAIFEEIPSLSIDYALMEKAEGVLICEGNFEWSDVGAWSALSGVWTQDAAGNASKGEGIFLDSTGCLVYNAGRLTALIGVQNIVVVNTRDALLVCRKDGDQKVKDVIELLKKQGRNRYL